MSPTRVLMPTGRFCGGMSWRSGAHVPALRESSRRQWPTSSGSLAESADNAHGGALVALTQRIVLQDAFQSTCRLCIQGGSEDIAAQIIEVDDENVHSTGHYRLERQCHLLRMERGEHNLLYGGMVPAVGPSIPLA